MKMTIVLLTAAFLNVSAKGVSQTVTYSGKNTSLVTVFKEVEQQTGLVFFYKEDMLKNTRPVSVIAENMPLLTFLDALFKDQPLKYTIKSRTITISRKLPAVAVSSDRQPNNTESINNSLYPSPIRGRVLDEDGNPLIGASVVVKGGKSSTSTNAQGVFSLNVSVGDVLVFSSVEFESKEQKVKASDIAKAKSAVVVSSDQQLEKDSKGLSQFPPQSFSMK